MNKEYIRDYLLEVAKEGYGNPDKERTKNPDGSTTIAHSSGPWSMHDNYFGGEPYGGSEVVFYEGKPIWMMVYYGEVNRNVTDIGKVLVFLQQALVNPDPIAPMRGPAQLEVGAMLYQNEWRGNLEKFKGEERILEKGKEVYIASYIGGLVDQRKE